MRRPCAGRGGFPRTSRAGYLVRVTCDVPGQQPGRPRAGSTHHGSNGAAGATVPPPGPLAHTPALLAGLREPIVLVLLAIAFFSAISGKPVDGVLMLIVAVGLGWDAGR